MKKPTIYLVWMDGEDEQYYNQYFTMADAVSDNGDGVEIYSATPKYRGKFKSKTAIVKIKQRKRRIKNGKTA